MEPITQLNECAVVCQETAQDSKPATPEPQTDISLNNAPLKGGAQVIPTDNIEKSIESKLMKTLSLFPKDNSELSLRDIKKRLEDRGVNLDEKEVNRIQGHLRILVEKKLLKVQKIGKFNRWRRVMGK